MTVISKYPIFEADQVLSQSHLNSIVSYFETQDRTTRKGLIGIGIVCGLEVSFPTSTQIKISCGTAVTSLGFQINWEEKIFSKYKVVDKLSDAFIAPNLIQEPFLKPVFDFNELYKSAAFTNFEELIETPISKISDDSIAYKAVDSSLVSTDINVSKETEKPIPSTSFLNGKVIVLVLEVSLIDQKKCSETNCDDKGKRLEFNLRPILINASKLDSSDSLNKSIKNKFEPLFLERFNAPQVSLTNGQQVLNAFLSKVENPRVINQIDEKIKIIYNSFQDDYFKSIFNFSALSNVKSIINDTVSANKTKWHLQYVWDWMNDIVAAYNQIITYNEKTSFTFCCLKTYESYFPFHIFLGKIETKNDRFLYQDSFSDQPLDVARLAKTDYNIISSNQNYITPWIKIASKKKKDDKLVLKLLIERLVLILNSFSITTSQKTYLDSPVKITPSFLGDYPLSKKSIPYYYNNISTLNKVWNPKASIKGENDKILSYYASDYSSVASTVYPLAYDMEPYNFLRIEGVIGKTYKQALESILAIRKNSQLPFNVIAINAVNLENVILNMSNHIGEWDEIELNYDLVRRDWENVIGKSIEWFLANSNLISPYFDIKRSKVKKIQLIQTSFEQFVSLLKSGRNSMVESFSDFIKIYTSFIDLYEKIEAIASQQRKLIFEDLAANEDKIFAEDLIDHLDQIIYVCQKGEFRALYQAAQSQWEKTSKDLTLTKFIEKHPGLEHKAGVTKGGTFVLVYQDKSIISRKIIAQSVNVQATPIAVLATDKAGTAKSAKAIDSSVKVIATDKTAFATSKTLSKELAVSKSDVFNVSIEEYKKKVQAYASHYLEEKSYNQLIYFMDELMTVSSIKEDPYGIPNETVIADFYLPYICCSQGNNINFILNEPDAGPADFSNSDFDSKDFYTN